MTSILQKILAILARRAIRRYHPTIIGVTGSVGKTSTRDAIFLALKSKYRVRTSEKNYNNEIGLPLTILGIKNYGRNIFAWFSALLRVAICVFLRKDEYPQILVLEYGIDKPGDMDYLLSIAHSSIAVVTAIGDVPAHIEFFKDPEELITEKTKLVAALPANGYAILNHDDYAVYDMKEKTKAHVTTFGFEEHAEVKIINYTLQSIKNEQRGDIPGGISFEIQHGGRVVPFMISGALGKPSAYAVTAASAVGMELGINLAEISKAMSQYVPPPGRLRLLRGNRDSFILDDTYNASPEALRSALDILEHLPGKRKIAVLGDMLEIGKYTEAAHRAIGDRVAEFVDMLITVGPRAKFIADEALTRGVEKKARCLTHEQILNFDDSVSAGEALDPLIRIGDLILVKGSQGMRMEKIVEEIMAEPMRAGELLVRQDESWKKKS